jgi:hypothetical protein
MQKDKGQAASASNAVSEQSRKLKELKNELNQIKQGGGIVNNNTSNLSMTSFDSSSRLNLSTTAGGANETIALVKSK